MAETHDSYYNENNPSCVSVLRKHISDGSLPAGFVDERSIEDVRESDVENYQEAHFFAGIGGFALASRGVPDARAGRIWTGGFPCFPAGSLVLTDKGYLPIEAVQIGMNVFTHKLRFMPVINTMKHTAPTVVVRGRGNNGIETTADHPFYSRTHAYQGYRENGRRKSCLKFTPPEWVRASEMVGRMWSTPCAFPDSEIPSVELREFEKPIASVMDDHFFWFVGAWLANGWIRRMLRTKRKTTNDQVYLCMGYHKADEFEVRLRETGIHFTRSEARTAVKFICSSKPLSRWLSQHFGEMAYGKTLPAWALGMPENLRKSLLRGYLDTEGYYHNHSWKAASVSKLLAHGIKLLAQSLGMPASVWFYRSKPQTVIEGRVVNQRDRWDIGVYENTKTQFEIDGMIWSRVKEVAVGEVKEVYNIGVHSDESYILDGAVVHNCQDISVAGRRAGLAGDRSGLYFEFQRLIVGVKPEWVVLENVPGLLSSNSGRDFSVVLAGLTGILSGVPENGWKNAGFSKGRAGLYSVAYRVLDAQYFGVPQRRRRVFIVGHLGDGRAAEILFERESGAGHPQPRRPTRQGTAAGAAGRASGSGSGSDPTPETYAMQRSDDYAPASVDATLAARQFKSATDLVTGTLAASGAGSARPSALANEADMLVVDLQQITSAANRSTPTAESPPLTSGQRIVAFTQNEREEARDLNGIAGALASEPEAHQQNYIAFMAGQGAKAGSIAASETTAPTLKSAGSGTNQVPSIAYGLSTYETPKFAAELQPTLTVPSSSGGGQPPATASLKHGVRRLTPVECERLQAFPDFWTEFDAAGKPQSDGARYRQLGNAVCVNVVTWIVQRIVAASRIEQSKEIGR